MRARGAVEKSLKKSRNFLPPVRVREKTVLLLYLKGPARRGKCLKGDVKRGPDFPRGETRGEERDCKQTLLLFARLNLTETRVLRRRRGWGKRGKRC